MYNPLVGPPPGVIQTNNRPSGAAFDASAGRVVIDGTPVRVVMLAAGAALGVMAFKWAGVKFNVGVSA